MKYPTLAEQIAGRCVHFNGVRHEACDAGVVYLTVRAEPISGLPCFRDGEAIPCEKRRFPTPDEASAEVAEIELRTLNLSRAVAACNKDAELRGIPKGGGGVGVIECPVCKKGVLRYSIAGSNGHMHGRCSTPKCVAWMQ